MKNLILALLLFTTQAFGAGVQEDEFQLGKPSSSSDKVLTFKGPTVKKLKHKSGTNELVYDGNNLTVGDGTASDKVLKFDKGSGSPSIKFNNSSGKLEFSHDNVTFKAIGSGSGSGGSGLNLIENSGFEDGTVGYSNTGGTVAVVSSGSNLLFDLKSVTFTASGSGQIFETAAITVPEGLKGTNCLARIKYKGGDANWIFEATDSSNVALGTPVTLKTSSVVTEAIDNFICPSSGSIKWRLRSTAAAALVALDNVKLGDADNLSTVSTHPSTEWVNCNSNAFGTLFTASTTSPSPHSTVVYNRCRWKREGSLAHIKWDYYGTGGGASAGSGIYLLNIPPEIGVIDMTKADANTVTTQSSYASMGTGFGFGTTTASSGFIHNGPLNVYSSTQLKLNLSYTGGGQGGIIFGDTTQCFQIAECYINYDIHVPISGWFDTAGPSVAISSLNANFGWTDGGPIGWTATTTAPTKGTVVTDQVRYKREGEDLLADYEYEQSGGGSGGSGDYLFALPAGLQFASSVFLYSTGVNITGTAVSMQKAFIGEGHIGNGSGARGKFKCFAYDSTRFRCIAEDAYVTYAAFGSSNYNIGGAANGWKARIRAPIMGWAASNVNAPVIVGGLITGSSAAERIERASLNNVNGSQAVNSSSSNWISAPVSCLGTGSCVYNISGFSGALSCTCSASGAAATACATLPLSSTQVRVNTYNGGTITNENDVQLICMGAR